MRHRKKGKQLGRTASHRKAMIANLSSFLILNEYIVTTKAKAKECKSFTDKVISIAKKKDLYSKRRVKSLLKDKIASGKLVDVLVDRYADREGGYVSMVKLGKRVGDDADMAKLYLVGSEPVRVKKKVKTKKKVKKQKEKKQEVEKKEKKGIFEKVKSLRQSIFDRRQGSGKGQQDVGAKRIETKSRSGI
ncbi:50S ribosomal protein L17 [Candidatus Dojkabacteria bacterium]|nr:50S ribosomal protein L17 [Candidatus Dojkabacteria bacterium]